jgi:DNA-binding NarL/FixJ family response regulator
MASLKTRILLADDHAVVRRGLRMVLEAQPDLVVAAEADDGAEALELGLREQIDLAILDIAMPRMTGLTVARELHRRRPKLRVLMLSMHENERYLYEALKAGASGYVVKTVADRDLVEAVRAAMRGEKFLYPGAVTPLIADYLHRARQDLPVREDPLTPREQEVVKLVAEGLTNKEIARRLIVTENTVKTHVTSLFNDLGVDSRAQAIAVAAHKGLL